ncbi:MAG: hypothetical protein JNM19_04265 [Chitinophagaceae bacterium]|nr:hypothetical protein [Chitinophagaceae bacterium]
MKFAPLLAQFLYTYKRLDLPGIGSFLLDSSTIVEAEQIKQGKPVALEGVSFEYNSATKQSPDLIGFIAGQTGKIKALAAADLESHLELAKQFLNIGKPFMFEGIGSLAKMQAGGYSFTPGHLITDKIKDTTAKETPATISTEEPVSDYRSIFYSKKAKTNWKKPVVILLLLAGIVLAIWGGYTVYKRTTSKKSTNPGEVAKQDKTVLVPDSADILNANPVATTATPPANTPTASVTVPSGNYKFVIENATRVRALSRYKKLKGYGINIQMETTDSVNFKLFFVFPAAIADTARITDSLRKVYSPTGGRAYVEN